MIKDADDVNTINAEERVYLEWVYGEKNRIMRFIDTKKKQIAWNSLFPKDIAVDGLSEEDLVF